MNDYLKTITTTDASQIDELRKNYILDNEWELVNPSDMEKAIKNLEDSITSFETDVDYVLSTSNAVTLVTVNLED